MSIKSSGKKITENISIMGYWSTFDKVQHELVFLEIVKTSASLDLQHPRARFQKFLRHDMNLSSPITLANSGFSMRIHILISSGLEIVPETGLWAL